MDDLRSAPPDAVILDLGLPDKRGGDVLAWLRNAAQQKTGSPVWIVVSAMDLREAVKGYGPLGEHFLPKPFDPWDLVQLLERLLSADGASQNGRSQG